MEFFRKAFKNKGRFWGLDLAILKQKQKQQKQQQQQQQQQNKTSKSK